MSTYSISKSDHPHLIGMWFYIIEIGHHKWRGVEYTYGWCDDCSGGFPKSIWSYFLRRLRKEGINWYSIYKPKNHWPFTIAIQWIKYSFYL